MNDEHGGLRVRIGIRPVEHGLHAMRQAPDVLRMTLGRGLRARAHGGKPKTQYDRGQGFRFHFLFLPLGSLDGAACVCSHGGVPSPNIESIWLDIRKSYSVRVGRPRSP